MVPENSKKKTKCQEFKKKTKIENKQMKRNVRSTRDVLSVDISIKHCNSSTTAPKT